MRRKLATLLILFGFGGFALIQALPPVSAANGHIAVLEIKGTIDPVSARYLSRGIDKAVEEQAHLIIVLLDTPGGLLSSTRDMVSKLLESEVPVAVYVSPAGARAAGMAQPPRCHRSAGGADVGLRGMSTQRRGAAAGDDPDLPRFRPHTLEHPGAPARRGDRPPARRSPVQVPLRPWPRRIPASPGRWTG